MEMEFWGLEVKPGETVKCGIEEEKFLHISQVSLGDGKKDKAGENIPIFVHINDQKLVLGTLSAERCPQFSLDLVFEKEFGLSHGSKTANVYFLGYKTTGSQYDSEFSDDLSDSDSEDHLQIAKKANGKPEPKEDSAKHAMGKVNVGKVDASAAKSRAKIDGEPKKSDKPKVDDEGKDDDDDLEDDESEDVSDDNDDEDMENAEDDSEDDDDDDSSDEEDETTPKKSESGKKRQPGSALKTPVPEKKAKVVTPTGVQKTGGEGKKSGHTATPHPAKQIGKTPGNTEKGKQQTPKSSGSVTCKSCSRSFNSENALQAHTKAKHGSN